MPREIEESELYPEMYQEAVPETTPEVTVSPMFTTHVHTDWGRLDGYFAGRDGTVAAPEPEPTHRLDGMRYSASFYDEVAPAAPEQINSMVCIGGPCDGQRIRGNPATPLDYVIIQEPIRRYRPVTEMLEPPMMTSHQYVLVSADINNTRFTFYAPADSHRNEVLETLINTLFEGYQRPTRW